MGGEVTRLDDALAGDVAAIGENLEQMIAALHKVDSTSRAEIDEEQHEEGFRSEVGFVKPATLDRLAVVVGRCVKADGSFAQTQATTKSIGQWVAASVKPDREGRAAVYLVLTTGRRTRGSGYLFMSPPALALRRWAEGRIRVRK